MGRKEHPTAQLGENLLVHLCSAPDWEAARSAGQVRPPSLADVGFVHLSNQHQVHLPANRLFVGRRDVVALYVDPAALSSELRWEQGVPGDPESMLFPHLYGPVPATAVVAVRPYRPGPDGRFAPLIPAEPRRQASFRDSGPCPGHPA